MFIGVFYQNITRNSHVLRCCFFYLNRMTWYVKFVRSYSWVFTTNRTRLRIQKHQVSSDLFWIFICSFSIACLCVIMKEMSRQNCSVYGSNVGLLLLGKRVIILLPKGLQGSEVFRTPFHRKYGKVMLFSFPNQLTCKGMPYIRGTLISASIQSEGFAVSLCF